MLAQIENADGVERVWIDGEGRLLRVQARRGTDIAKVLAGAGLEVEKIDWHRRDETIRFSEKEAKILAERYAGKAKEAASLTDEQTTRLRGILERRILEQFRANHASREVKELIPIDVEPVLREAAGFLSEEQVQTLRRLLPR